MMFLDESRMSEHQRQLQRWREQAKRTFERLAGLAEREGCTNLAARIRRLNWNVGSRMSTPTPPALAAAVERRFPKLLAAAKADPSKSFYELQPVRRQKHRAIMTPEPKNGTRR